ncbi:MAG: hypothetical protein ACFFFK_06360 [Candidatus Thorarchaeota archaeon]
MILFSTIIVFEVYSDVEGPSIYQIDVLPVSPSVGGQISVTAYGIDASGISKAQLSYTIDGEKWEVQDMMFIACLCAAGGRWVSTFGPISEGDLPMFYVTMFDNSPIVNPSSSQTFSIEIVNQSSG